MEMCGASRKGVLSYLREGTLGEDTVYGQPRELDSGSVGDGGEEGVVILTLWNGSSDVPFFCEFRHMHIPVTRRCSWLQRHLFIGAKLID